jgi:hypothetical protein
VVYDLVAESLGLNARDCKTAGLVLVLVPGQCIGFSKGAFGPNVTNVDAVTLYASPLKNYRAALIEAAFCGYDALPVYSATGIWVPFDGAKEKAYGARVDYQSFNALLE